MKKNNIILFVIFFMFISLNNLYSQRIKWLENFDDGEPESRGWKFINNDDGSTDIELNAPLEFYQVGLQYPKSGGYFIKVGFESSNRFNQIDDWIVSPKLYNIQKHDTMSFWCGAIDRTFKDSLKVMISTTDVNPESFTEIDYFKVDGPVGSWHKKSYDLSAYSGKDIYFAVNYYILDAGGFGGSSDNVWIDQFVLSGTGYSGVIPGNYNLYQNFPNPFNPSTEITFELPQKSFVNLKVYNSLGKEISQLVNTEYFPGIYSVAFDGSNLPSGIYFYVLEAGSFSDKKKMALIK